MKVLITEDFHPNLEIGLTILGMECSLNISIDYNGVCNIIQDYEILIVNSKIRIDEFLLSKAKKLKIVGRIGSGMDVFDKEACERYGVKCITSPEGNANAVAEHIIGFILSAFNNISKSQSDMLSGNWNREENRGIELCGKTLAIIGFGNNGRRLAELLQGFDLEILALDIREVDFNIKNVKAATLEEIYSKTDILSIHLPLTKDTQDYITSSFLSKFKKPIYLVNASRGKICKTEVVLAHLESGKIKKAMLDVFDLEPLIINKEVRYWIEKNKLFLTPHIAGWTEESKIKLAETLVNKIKNNI